MSKEYAVKVSVIIPSFNAAAYIKQTLESVINQTEHDLEVIVSDDFSTDNTIAVVEEMIKLDDRIKLIKSLKNKGPSYSRNRAISEANGKWIALLDADDFYHKERLKELIKIGEECNADVVADNIYYVNEHGQNPKMAINNLKIKNKHEIVSTKSFILNNLPGGENFKYGYLQPIILKSFLSEHNIRYDETARVGEDFIFSVECLLNGAKFILANDAFYYYRIVNTSLSQRIDINGLAELSDNNLKLIKIAKDIANNDACRHLQYRQKLIAYAELYYEISSYIKNRKFLLPLKKIIINPDAWLFFYAEMSIFIKRHAAK